MMCEKVENLIHKTIEDLGYELYDVIYEKEAQDYYLRIFIDTPNGISLEDCEKVNNAINDLLDNANIIKEQYFLEVSSTGIEKILRKDKHLEQSIGKEIEIKLFKKNENGKKLYQGILQEFNKEKIVIKNNETENEIEQVKIERKNVAQIKLIFHW